jgi:hypothetical protein
MTKIPSPKEEKIEYYYIRHKKHSLCVCAFVSGGEDGLERERKKNERWTHS